MANKIQNPISIIDNFGDTEYVVNDTDLFSAMRDLKQGGVIWYRDYDNTADQCISLCKRIERTTFMDEDVFIIHFDMVEDSPTDAIIIRANAKDEQLRLAFKDMGEWIDYYGRMLVDEDVFNEHFRAEDNEL